MTDITFPIALPDSIARAEAFFIAHLPTIPDAVTYLWPKQKFATLYPFEEISEAEYAETNGRTVGLSMLHHYSGGRWYAFALADPSAPATLPSTLIANVEQLITMFRFNVPGWKDQPMESVFALVPDDDTYRLPLEAAYRASGWHPDPTLWMARCTPTDLDRDLLARVKAQASAAGITTHLVEHTLTLNQTSELQRTLNNGRWSIDFQRTAHIAYRHGVPLAINTVRPVPHGTWKWISTEPIWLQDEHDPLVADALTAAVLSHAKLPSAFMLTAREASGPQTNWAPSVQGRLWHLWRLDIDNSTQDPL